MGYKMSDYCKKFVVRYRPTKEQLMEVIGETYDEDTCEFDLFPGMFNRSPFSIGCTVDYDGDGKSRYYIDYTIDYSYGEESGDYGRARMLTQDESTEAIKLFRKLFQDITDSSNMRVVEYCYYDCSEPQDYFDVKQAKEPFYSSVAGSIREYLKSS